MSKEGSDMNIKRGKLKGIIKEEYERVVKYSDPDAKTELVGDVASKYNQLVEGTESYMKRLEELDDVDAGELELVRECLDRLLVLVSEDGGK